MNAQPRRAAFYLRVSTDGQTTENQRLELTKVAERAGWIMAEVYEDAGISGGKGRDKRPAFDRLLKDAARRQFDVVAAWSVDRLGRSLQDLVSFLSDIHGYGIDLYLHQQGIDTTTPGGKAMFQMLGVFSEFERAMIRERVHAGLNRARAQGKTLGRPKTGADTEAAILKTLRSGVGVLKAAKLHGVGTSVAQRVKVEMKRNHPQPTEPQPKVMKVKLWLQVENNSKFVRGKSKSRGEIERDVLSRFAMEKIDKNGWEYILSIPYTTDEKLDQIIYEEIYAEAERIADYRYGFIEAYICWRALNFDHSFALNFDQGWRAG